jgi:hypothetical protein
MLPLQEIGRTVIAPESTPTTLPPIACGSGTSPKS